MQGHTGSQLITSPLFSTPQGEPGAEGAAGKEVLLCWLLYPWERCLAFLVLNLP